MTIWLDWLRQELMAHRQRIQQGQTIRPVMQADGLRFHLHQTESPPHHNHTAHHAHL